jgi:predicted SnoaL-like aldol condensation-catalyzing enzyme
MSTLHPNIATLRSIYDDLRRIERHADEDMVLHTAQRHAAGDSGIVYGRKAVVEKMNTLILQSGRTLEMSVHSIVANDYFGAVLGSINARFGDREIGMPFCGLWRFRDGCIMEHWENAYDIAELDAFMDNEISEPSNWVRQ